MPSDAGIPFVGNDFLDDELADLIAQRSEVVGYLEVDHDSPSMVQGSFNQSNRCGVELVSDLSRRQPGVRARWSLRGSRRSLKQASTVYQSMWDGSRCCSARSGRQFGWCSEVSGVHQDVVQHGVMAGWYHVASIHPRSTSGSPIVHISQSTIATTSGPVGENMTFAA